MYFLKKRKQKRVAINSRERKRLLAEGWKEVTQHDYFSAGLPKRGARAEVSMGA